jgi:hypothetical protein
VPAPANVSEVEKLSTEIAQLPERGQAAARRGYHVAAGLTEAARSKVLEAVVREFGQSGGSVDGEVIAREAGIPVPDANQLLTALTITVALLTQAPVSPAAFIEAGRDKLFDPSSEPAALSIANLITPRHGELEKTFARQSLATSVLPALSRFQLAVDLRVRFSNGELEEFVPVAVVYIDTDAEGQNLVMQLTRSDIDNVIAKLHDAAQQLALAEGLLTKNDTTRAD